MYRSAAGSTVELIGSQPQNWTIDFRPAAERVSSAWRSVRYRPDPPRISIWFRGQAEPQDILLKAVQL